MNKAEKLLTFNYYLHAEVCVCGKPKARVSWVCKACKVVMHGTEAGLAMDAACSAHVRSAIRFLDECRNRDKANEPTYTATAG